MEAQYILADGVVDVQLVLGGISAVVAALSSAVAYLFKLYYVDTKTALNDCKDQHKSAKVEFQQLLHEEKEGCQKELSKLTVVVQEKQVQITSLQNQMFDLAKHQSATI